MANFAVAASNETIEKANKIMELYAKEGDKKEDVLLRILSIAEKESVKGTHPELESSLNAIDGTIATLIKQINGIVAGQDMQIEELKSAVEKALEEKQTAMEQARIKECKAEEKILEADRMVKDANETIHAEREKAYKEIEEAKKKQSRQTENAKMREILRQKKLLVTTC